jgi:hypothetical protein
MIADATLQSPVHSPILTRRYALSAHHGSSSHTLPWCRDSCLLKLNLRNKCTLNLELQLKAHHIQSSDSICPRLHVASWEKIRVCREIELVLVRIWSWGVCERQRDPTQNSWMLKKSQSGSSFSNSWTLEFKYYQKCFTIYHSHFLFHFRHNVLNMPLPFLLYTCSLTSLAQRQTMASVAIEWMTPSIQFQAGLSAS